MSAGAGNLDGHPAHEQDLSGDNWESVESPSAMPNPMDALAIALFGRPAERQGERIYLIRFRRGGKPGQAQSMAAFAKDLATASGEDERQPSTIQRWELDSKDAKRGPTGAELVVMARWAGKTVEWLVGLDEKLKAAREERRGTEPRKEPGRRAQSGVETGAAASRQPRGAKGQRDPEQLKRGRRTG